ELVGTVARSVGAGGRALPDRRLGQVAPGVAVERREVRPQPRTVVAAVDAENPPVAEMEALAGLAPQAGEPGRTEALAPIRAQSVGRWFVASGPRVVYPGQGEEAAILQGDDRYFPVQQARLATVEDAAIARPGAPLVVADQGNRLVAGG